jgi:hypothetical protein
MPILSWDKPKKKRSKKDWEESYGFDGGPTGGYQPNMSDDDNARWKAKITGQKLGFPQVEIRKAVGSQMTVIVNLGDGYNYKYYRALPDEDHIGKTPEDYKNEDSYMYRIYDTQQKLDRFSMGAATTRGQQVHIALNGPAQMTFDEIRELNLAIDEAKVALEELTGVKGERKSYVLLVDDLSIDLKGILGLTEHFRLPGYKAVVVTAPEWCIPFIEQRPGVRYMTEEEFIKRINADDARDWEEMDDEET